MDGGKVRVAFLSGRAAGSWSLSTKRTYPYVANGFFNSPIANNKYIVIDLTLGPLKTSMNMTSSSVYAYPFQSLRRFMPEWAKTMNLQLVCFRLVTSPTKMWINLQNRQPSSIARTRRPQIMCTIHGPYTDVTALSDLLD